MTTTATSYDDVLYPSYVHPQTHPDRLAVIATLFGMQPVAPEQSRILELACGQGGNLIPLACSYPNSSCLGIDLSERQISQGQEVITALGLSNVELRHQSILDFPSDAGKYDFIIAHGVFSWVPENVRDKILQICREHLSEQGVAIVSYNTYPGWHQRRMIRDMMRFHTKGFNEPNKRIEQAKAFLTFMTKAIPDDSAYGKSLHEEFQSLSNVDAAYLFHEQLEDVNEPKYFHEFAEHAAKHDLQYLSEVELSNLLLERYPKQIAEVLGKMDTVQREQYLDFLLRRTFRQTLLCHRELARNPHDMPSRIGHMWVTSSLFVGRSAEEMASEQPIVFELPGGRNLAIGGPLVKTAFALMANAWPESIPVADLLEAVHRACAGDNSVVPSSDDYQRNTQTLTHTLTHAFIEGVVQLRTGAPPFTKTVTPTPKACPLARYQAQYGHQQVTNREHRFVAVDPLSRKLLSLLDGSTDCQQLLDHLVRYVSETNFALQYEGAVVKTPEKVRELLHENLESNLSNLSKQAFLVG